MVTRFAVDYNGHLVVVAGIRLSICTSTAVRCFLFAPHLESFVLDGTGLHLSYIGPKYLPSHWIHVQHFAPLVFANEFATDLQCPVLL